MEDTAHEYFGAMVEEYDSLLRRAVPRYDEMIERAITYVPSDKRDVLELGCGTGNFTVALSAHLPQAELTLVDASAEMLACARGRLPAERRVHCVESLFEELVLEPASFDLITSCISLHHVEDMGKLIERLFGLLRPGGHLLYADQMRGGTEAYHELNWGRMVDFWKRPGNLQPAEMDSLTEHRDLHDHHVSVMDQLEWMRAAGFVELDCVWRNWMWGVLAAKRPDAG